jgi:hypothetical protein
MVLTALWGVEGVSPFVFEVGAWALQHSCAKPAIANRDRNLARALFTWDFMA